MATAVLPYVSVEQYLHSVYEPDVDYVDGVLEERNLGEFDHGDLQTELSTWLRNHSEEWQIRVVVETRVQVAPTRYRVPDICVMPLSWKREPIIRQAPLLCVEVLSPEDRWPRVQRRYADFLSMGTPEVWVLDPAKRLAYVMTSAGIEEQPGDASLRLAGTPIEVSLPALFVVLDR